MNLYDQTVHAMAIELYKSKFFPSHWWHEELDERAKEPYVAVADKMLGVIWKEVNKEDL